MINADLTSRSCGYIALFAALLALSIIKPGFYEPVLSENYSKVRLTITLPAGSTGEENAAENQAHENTAEETKATTKIENQLLPALPSEESTPLPAETTPPAADITPPPAEAVLPVQTEHISPTAEPTKPDSTPQPERAETKAPESAQVPEPAAAKAAEKAPGPEAAPPQPRPQTARTEPRTAPTPRPQPQAAPARAQHSTARPAAQNKPQPQQSTARNGSNSSQPSSQNTAAASGSAGAAAAEEAQLKAFTGDEILALLKSRSTYPKQALRRKIQGTVIIEFTLNSGEITACSLAKSSGSDILDRAALKLAQSLIGHHSRSRATLRLQVPLRYALNQR